MGEKSRSPIELAESSKIGAIGAGLIFAYVMYGEIKDRREYRKTLAQRRVNMRAFAEEAAQYMYELERDDRDGLGGGPLARGFDESMHNNRDLYPDLPFGPLALEAIKNEWENPRHPEIHRERAPLPPLAGSIELRPEGVLVERFC